MLIHTSYFFWATIILFMTTALFYVVFFSLIRYWHETKQTLIVLPVLFTFEFFIITFLVVSLASIVLQYLPDILAIIG